MHYFTVPQLGEIEADFRKGNYARIGREQNETKKLELEINSFKSEEELIDYIKNSSFAKKDDIVYLLNTKNELMPINDAIILKFDSYHLIDYFEYLRQIAYDNNDMKSIPKYNYFGIIKNKKGSDSVFKYIKYEFYPKFNPNQTEYHIENSKYQYDILKSIMKKSSNKQHKALAQVIEDNKEMMLRHMMK
jgi:hypothetical protein